MTNTKVPTSTESALAGTGDLRWTRPTFLGRSWWTPGRIGLITYALVLGLYCVTQGIPMDRIGQTGWIILGITAARIGEPLHAHGQAILDWLPLLVALIIYDHTRGIADTLGMPVRVAELADVERTLFGGTIPTTWLQQHLYDPAQVHWWDIGVSVVYFSHFIVPWVLAAVLYMRSRSTWTRYIRRVLLLSYAGLLTYVLLPAAPPWYAARVDVIPEGVSRIATRGWDELGLHSAGAWLSEAQAGANQVAALPSLHSAFAMLVAVTLWSHMRRPATRALLALYPLAMAFTLVYGGEHYVLDVLAGWYYVALVMLVAYWWESRRAQSAAPAQVVVPASR